MACTSQSAEGYIRSARRHLVGELKNLTVILENLYQRGVLCDEEVSKIQAEKDDYDKTRKILDSVTNKGEKACYEFLKIIDMTRKRTLVRHPLHPGTKTFDLHHWISCFSFKEDTETNANYLQDKLDYHLDLSGVSVDPYPCCAVAYVVTQSEKKKICLNLEDVVISEQGMRQLFECFKNVQWSGPLPRLLWEIFLINEEQMDFVRLLSLDGNLHLLVDGEKKLFESAVEVMQRMHTKVNVCLYWDKETPACHSQCESLLKALPFISSLSFRGPVSWRQEKYHGTLEREQERLFMDLCLKAAIQYKEKNKHILKWLLLLFPVKTDIDNIFLDLFEHC
ncbi:uncharacterized protein LOC118454870 [Neolamprologus brichardi]|uniref:uncharacterized protein LOC118454870 n=1 Tax=Neolamprologus brichardi TaxID=32507 RepID=UPI001643DE4A|nr:uncharacterized protein LOC118454870 [Neolamprologus brichardi]